MSTKPFTDIEAGLVSDGSATKVRDAIQAGTIDAKRAIEIMHAINKRSADGMTHDDGGVKIQPQAGYLCFWGPRFYASRSPKWMLRIKPQQLFAIVKDLSSSLAAVEMAASGADGFQTTTKTSTLGGPGATFDEVYYGMLRVSDKETIKDELAWFRKAVPVIVKALKDAGLA